MTDLARGESDCCRVVAWVELLLMRRSSVAVLRKGVGINASTGAGSASEPKWS